MKVLQPSDLDPLDFANSGAGAAAVTIKTDPASSVGQAIAASQTGLSAVASDATLAGDGTAANPLSVNPASALAFDPVDFYTAINEDGTPITTIKDGLDAAGLAISGLLGGASEIMTNPTMFVRSATGSDANDGSTEATAFKTFAGLQAYMASVYTRGTLTIDARGEFGQTVLSNYAYKGASSIVLLGDPLDASALIFNAGNGVAPDMRGLAVFNAEVEARDFTINGGLGSPRTAGVFVGLGGNLQIGGRIVFTGDWELGYAMFTTVSGSLLTTRLAIGNVPRTVVEFNVNPGARTVTNIFLATNASRMVFMDTRFEYVAPVAGWYVLSATKGAGITFAAGVDPADAYPTQFIGNAGDFVGHVFEIFGPGSFIEQGRVPLLDMGIEQEYFKTLGNNRILHMSCVAVYGSNTYDGTVSTPYV